MNLRLQRRVWKHYTFSKTPKRVELHVRKGTAYSEQNAPFLKTKRDKSLADLNLNILITDTDFLHRFCQVFECFTRRKAHVF